MQDESRVESACACYQHLILKHDNLHSSLLAISTLRPYTMGLEGMDGGVGVGGRGIPRLGRGSAAPYRAPFFVSEVLYHLKELFAGEDVLSQGGLKAGLILVHFSAQRKRFLWGVHIGVV